MAVAAAIGVCSDDMDCGPTHSMPDNLSSRLANKLKADRQTNSPAVMGDINRSIEKMSIGGGKSSSSSSSMRAGQTSLTSSGYGSSGRSMCQNGMIGGTTLPTPTTTPAVNVVPNVGVNNVGRRDSNWTNSTEGYGSMRSEQSMMSRRCSDVSAMSVVSPIAQILVHLLLVI